LEAVVKRRPVPAPALVVFLAVLFAGLWAAPAVPGAPQADQGKNGARNPADLIKGKWQAEVGGRQYTLDLRLEEGALVGTVQPPNRKSVKIEDGIFVVDEFSFTTVEDDVEWEWSGTLSDAGLAGERERVDSDAREDFTAKRKP
jgi:hypothetical protein